MYGKHLCKTYEGQVNANVCDHTLERWNDDQVSNSGRTGRDFGLCNGKGVLHKKENSPKTENVEEYS